MTSEIQENISISELEKRISKLEQILIEKEDVLHVNFDGFEIPTKDEIELIEEAEKDMLNNTARKLDDVLS